MKKIKKNKKQKVVRFIQPRELPSVIWDPENNCPLVEFYQWTYETDDPKIIKILKGMGYPVEGVDPVPAFLHPEGQEPAEPIIVNDNKKVPPRPANMPLTEEQDLRSTPKASIEHKPKRRKLKRRDK